MPQLSDPAQTNDINSIWGDDHDNARNWSTNKKIYNTAVPGLLCFLMFVLSCLKTDSLSLIRVIL